MGYLHVLTSLDAPTIAFTKLLLDAERNGRCSNFGVKLMMQR